MIWTFCCWLVADIAAILVLSTLRRIGEGISLVKSGNVSVQLEIRHVAIKTPLTSRTLQWKQQPWAPFVNCGLSIGHPSLTIGFLGFGRISQATVQRLLAFTNKKQPPLILYTSSYRRDNQDEIDANLSKTFGVEVRREEKEILASQADIVIVLCDLNPSTKDMVNKSFFQKMKKSAILVNVARVRYGEL